MPSYDIRVRSDAPPQAVFDLVSDATSWSRWAGPMVRKSWWGREGDDAPGGVGAIRRLGSKAFSTQEQITEYDPPHYLAYTILGRSPVKDYRAIVSLDPDGDGTRITWAGAFEPALPGTGGLLRLVLMLIVGSMAKRLARYASAQTPGAK